MERSSSATLAKSLARKDSQKQEAFLEPTVPVMRMQMEQSALALVGILQKYVNFGKGWRPRLFVLQNGVLKYYKIYGPTGVDVGAVLKWLSQRCEIQIIGARTHLENSKGIPAGQELPTTPQGEIHLQVSSVRASTSDNKKFYVHSGTKTVQVRTETSEDRSAWVEALNGAKNLWSKCQEASTSLPPASESDTGMDELSVSLDRVMERLQAVEVGQEVAQEVKDLFLQQQRLYQDFARQEAAKRRVLLEYVKEFEEDKRQLETQAVQEASVMGLNMVARMSSQDGEMGGPMDHDSDDEVDNDEQEDDVFWQDALEEDLADIQPTTSGIHVRESSLLSGTYSPGTSRTVSRVSSAAQRAESLTTPTFVQSDVAPISVDMAEPKPSSTDALPNGSATNHLATAGKPVPAVQLPIPDWLKEAPVVKRRDRLPKPQNQERPVSLWQLIKGVVGKDLTRVCLPVYFNEPLSALQKCAEDLEYSELLDLAAQQPAGSQQRMMYLAAFAVSGYAGTLGRTCKPFNPLLGETFELVYADKGWRFISEKVMHHPMIFAVNAEGRGWTVDADIEMKSKFWGRSIEIHPAGVIELRFHDGEVFHWNKVVSSINNIIIGRINVTHGGVMRVRSLTHPISAKLTFHEATFLNPQLKHVVTGHLEDANGRIPGVHFKGMWDTSFSVDLDGQERLLWERAPSPEDPTRYNLTAFAIILNETTPDLEGKMAPTDCRLRPDQKCLEQGRYDEANTEKFRLEEKQRAVRKATERGEAPPFVPRWFTAVPGAKQGHGVLFKYHGGYWETREKGGPYTGCRDIYSGGNVKI